MLMFLSLDVVSTCLGRKPKTFASNHALTHLSHLVDAEEFPGVGCVTKFAQNMAKSARHKARFGVGLNVPKGPCEK